MRGVRPLGGRLLAVRRAVAAPEAAQRLDRRFSQKPVISEVFHRGTRGTTTNNTNPKNNQQSGPHLGVADVRIELNRAEPVVAVNDPVDGVAWRFEHVVAAVLDQRAMAVE